MKYRVLLKFLQFLVYLKRFFWRVGSGIYFVIGLVAGSFTRFVLHLRLKIEFSLKRLGFSQSSEWVWKRDFVQIIILLLICLSTFSQTKAAGKSDLSYVGQKTLIYAIYGGSDEINLEDEFAPVRPDVVNNYSWRAGAISVTEGVPGGEMPEENYSLGTTIVGGVALSRPNLISGVVASSKRLSEIEYKIEQGDSLSSIAYEFGVSLNTLLWNNNLTLRSILKPGFVLKIPPVDGVVHEVKKGDTLSKIAKLYNAKLEEIIEFNRLKSDGSDMKIGERLAIPNGVKKQTVVATVVRSIAQTISRRPAPPGSSAAPSIAGFVWPSAAHIITQYYGLSHHALDIAGKWQSAIYATKSGTVIKSQCGWNSGYGCYIIVDHGDGVRSLYGHNSQLLVSVGDYVETGQTIALMGNTGKVRGVTGIHSHFEIIVNGGRVNPLRYVK